MQKPHNITNRKRLPWCELIIPYNFFLLSMCFTIRHKKRFGETLKLPRLTRVSGASRSRPPSRKLQRLVSAQKVSCTSLVFDTWLTHIGLKRRGKGRDISFAHFLLSVLWFLFLQYGFSTRMNFESLGNINCMFKSVWSEL